MLAAAAVVFRAAAGGAQVPRQIPPWRGCMPISRRTSRCWVNSSPTRCSIEGEATCLIVDGAGG